MIRALLVHHKLESAVKQLKFPSPEQPSPRGEAQRKWRWNELIHWYALKYFTLIFFDLRDRQCSFQKPTSFICRSAKSQVATINPLLHFTDDFFFFLFKRKKQAFNETNATDGRGQVLGQTVLRNWDSPDTFKLFPRRKKKDRWRGASAPEQSSFITIAMRTGRVGLQYESKRNNMPESAQRKIIQDLSFAGKSTIFSLCIRSL